MITLDELYALYYDMRARDIRPSHWIVGVAVFPELLRLQTPSGDYVAQAGSIQRGPTILGLSWEIDHANPDRLDLAPSPYGGVVVRDMDGSVLIASETEEADRILKQLGLT